MCAYHFQIGTEELEPETHVAAGVEVLKVPKLVVRRPLHTPPDSFDATAD
jgi:hypothetical protein